MMDATSANERSGLDARTSGGASGTPNPAMIDLAYKLTLRNGWNLKDIRDPGTGKTKRAKARCAAAASEPNALPAR